MGWWQPENFLVQNKVYFGADKFFYIDSLRQTAPYSGTWTLDKNVIRCKTTAGDHIIKFEISSVNANKIYLITVSVGVLQPFNKTAEPAITSAPLLSFAGTGVKGFSGDSGPATAAAIGEINAITTDKFGNVYFSDYTYRIRKISVTDGKVTTVAGTGIFGTGAPNNVPALTTNISAYRLAVDDAENIYFAQDLKIFKISKSTGLINHIAGGGTLTEDGVPAKQAVIGSIEGIAAKPNGDLYIADLRNNRIKKVSAGILTIVAATEGGPSSIAIDKSNNVYFTDRYTVKKLTNGVKPISTIVGKAYADANDYIPGDGGPASKAMFRSINTITVSAKGDIFVTDGFEHTVRKVDAATKIITRFAGYGFPGVVSSGLHASACPLYRPYFLTTDIAGNNLYIGSGSYRIFKVAVSQ